ncbi:MAG TPA: CpaF family protein [Terriglobales bacterium]|jgi:pilus assembly protein CpaF|nr:CpaF family protein [Caulobacteraceae bacterium]
MTLWSDQQETPAKGGGGGKTAAPIEGASALKSRIHTRLLDVLNLALIERTPRETLRHEVRAVVIELLSEEKRLLTPKQTDQLTDDVLDEILGLGPLEPLLKDDSIADILINTHDTVYIERRGRLELTDIQFQDNRHLVRIINKIVSAVGRRVDESSPMVDARLADGSRVNAIIPPLSVDGPLVSIRKFSREALSVDRLVGFGSLTEEMSLVLRAIVQARRNVLISGGTGSGKTTLLNAMSAFIDVSERIITIEDSAELQLQQPHIGRLETRPPNIEGKGEITQRDLVKNALRMRPDRIIVGEVRSGEAFDMLQAMNTGHDGSMTTVHANTARDALNRIEQMIGMAGLDISPRSIRQQIASAINVVLQTERSEDGRRRVISIAEIVGMEEDTITMQEIFRFRRKGRTDDGTVLGDFEATGVRPKFLEFMGARGIRLDPQMFAPVRRSA